MWNNVENWNLPSASNYKIESIYKYPELQLPLGCAEKLYNARISRLLGSGKPYCNRSYNCNITLLGFMPNYITDREVFETQATVFCFFLLWHMHTMIQYTVRDLLSGYGQWRQSSWAVQVIKINGRSNVHNIYRTKTFLSGLWLNMGFSHPNSTAFSLDYVIHTKLWPRSALTTDF